MSKSEKQPVVTALEEPPKPAAGRNFNAQAVHLTRTLQVNTLTLSQMADQKASILIGATFVVFSITVTSLTAQSATLSTIALVVTAFISSLFAVLAVIPSLAAPPASPAMRNPLFFGHFAALDEEEWTQDMLDRLADEERFFRSMLHDVYQNGQVLYRRKYRLLTLAYRTFLIGLLITMMIYLGEVIAAWL
ncbi:MAG: Pycsar system effector family protein [Erythrobacter sp.]|jgi:hypothetical protein|nr:Pycsar system effector family protein [Erythrobacter sp.]